MQQATHAVVKSLVAGALLGIAGLSVGQEVKPEDAIEYRQALYRVIGWNFKPMGAMVKGEIPFDQESFAQRAQRVAAMGPMLPEGFTPGSDLGETDALPKIWEEQEKFSGLLNDFQSESAKLAEVAQQGDEGAIKRQFLATAKTCKNCHDNYRAD